MAVVKSPPEIKVCQVKHHVSKLYCRQDGEDSSMTPEEKDRFERFERQMEFLAHHQAQLATDLESLKDIVRNHSAQIAEHSTQIGQIGDFIRRIGRIVEEQARLADERMARTDEHMARTDERMARTDERLNALITMIERYISRRGNGKE
jgi:chromosome segregation ATPase